MCSIFIVSSIVPYECPVSLMCHANLEFEFLVLTARMCSLNLSLNVRPICPTYLSGHSSHFNWYTPLRLYTSSVLCRGFRRRWIVLLVLNVYFYVGLSKYFGKTSIVWINIGESGPLYFLLTKCGISGNFFLYFGHVICCLYPLFFSISCILFRSCTLFSSERNYMFILSIR
jgi:hypothetical protein